MKNLGQINYSEDYSGRLAVLAVAVGIAIALIPLFVMKDDLADLLKRTTAAAAVKSDISPILKESDSIAPDVCVESEPSDTAPSPSTTSHVNAKEMGMNGPVKIPITLSIRYMLFYFLLFPTAVFFTLLGVEDVRRGIKKLIRRRQEGKK